MRPRIVHVCLASLLTGALAAGTAGAAPSDPYFSEQWGLLKINAEEAWTVATGEGALIAIVDTGVDLGHPDLDANIVSFADADFVEPNRGDGPQDENGHGTHVAGIVAAETANGIGVAGTAPAAKILPVRVLDEEGAGTTEEVADGIRYAADKGAHVINVSLGFLSGAGEAFQMLGVLDPIYNAIEYASSKGAVVVVAAGNDTYPLCAEPADAPGVLCVGATDSRDLKSWFSNFESSMTLTYLVAPGGDGLTCSGDIFSTYLRTETTFCSDQAGYEAQAGTSMAAPFVSGVAGLLAGKGLTNVAIVDCIIRTTNDLGPSGRDPIYGYGRVNAHRAVTSC